MSKEAECRRLRNALDVHHRTRSDAISRGHEERNKAWDARRELQDLEAQLGLAELALTVIGGPVGAVRRGRTVGEAIGGAVAASKKTRLEQEIERWRFRLDDAERAIGEADFEAERTLRLIEFTRAEMSVCGC